MVYSLSLAKQYINQDTVITYSDIIYNPKIVKTISGKGNILALKKIGLKYGYLE